MRKSILKSIPNKTIMALLFLVLASSVFLPQEIQAKTCSGLTGNGTTDDSDALEGCLSSAIPGDIINLPSGKYLLNGNRIFIIPEKVSLVGATGAEIINGSFSLSNYSKIISFEFSGRDRAIIIGERALVTGAEVRNNTFGSSPTWTTLLAYRANDCIIDNNTFNGAVVNWPTIVGGNIQFGGGKRNKITNNKIYGGRTSIIWLPHTNLNGATDMFEDNEITGNYVENPSEEAITLDGRADSDDNIAAKEYDKLSSVGTNQVTLSNSNWAKQSSPGYVGYDLVFIDGNLIGQTRKIISRSGATLTLDGSVAGAAVGNQITIGATAKRNLIAHNTVVGSWTAINLYGMCFNNIVEYNTVTTDIIKSVSSDNGRIFNGSVTKTYGRGPNGYNIIRYNTLENASSPTKGVIESIYFHIPKQQWHDNVYSPYTTYGNCIYGNKIGNKLRGYLQSMYVSNNTGKQDLTDVNLLAQCMEKNSLPGDFNSDNKVNTLDYEIMKTEFLKTGTNLKSDMNKDNKVNTLDYELFRREFGKKK